MWRALGDRLSPMTHSAGVAAPIPVIIVASWYPGVDDPARGRFVADQAEALAATGRVTPIVTSFEDVRVEGDRLARRDDLRAFDRHRAMALASHPTIVNRLAWGGADGIPTARVPALVGIGKAAPAGSEGDLRREALLTVADRIGFSGPVGVVHAHTAYPDGFAAAALAKRLGWPLVVTEHASFFGRYLRNAEERRRYVEAVDTAQRFLAVSRMLADELSAAIPELDAKLEVMPNTVPLDEYVAAGLDQRRPEELLFVGYRKATKGIAVLLRAFVDIRAARPGATLRLIGRSPTEEVEQEWRQMADDLGIADAVQFDPPMGRAGVVDAMSRASLLVHPSVRETFGMTVLEALASGMPVVAARWGGISGILDDPRLGQLVPPYDSRALAKAVLRVLDRRASFDPAVLRAAVAPYAAATVARRLVALYEDLIARAGAAESRGPLPLTGSAAPLPERILVVAHDTVRAAELLGNMPFELLRRMVLVTTGGDRSSAMPKALGTVVTTEELVVRALDRVGLRGSRGTFRNRLERAARNPRAAVERRLSARKRAAMRTRAIVAGTRAALEERAVSRLLDGGGAAVVCVDEVDYEAVAPLVAAGRLTPLPGGPIWLADAWASAQAAAGSASRSSTMSASRSPITVQS